MENDLLKQILEKLSEIQVEQSGMKQEINLIKDEQEYIKKAVLEINKRTVEILNKLDEHDGLIEVIDMRTLRQEAQLKKKLNSD